jgi:hypothetical protein
LKLRRVWLDPLVANDRTSKEEKADLRDCLTKMIEFVEALGLEYEKSYLPIARQQRVDEEYLKVRQKDLLESYPSSNWPEDPMFKPTRAWELLCNEREKFQHLHQLIGGDEYEKSCFWFVAAFTQVKLTLEKRAGIKRQSSDLGAQRSAVG